MEMLQRLPLAQQEEAISSVEKISEKGENYSSQYVEGDTIKVQFRSDRSINKWGFVIEEIEVVKKK